MISLLLLCGSLDDHQDLRSPYATSANRNVSAHIARTGDAVGDEGRQNDVTSTGEPIAKGGMNMHCPKGPESGIGRLHRSSARSSVPEFFRAGHRGDVSVGDNHGLVCLERMIYRD
jgi:hypothetical protein